MASESDPAHIASSSAEPSSVPINSSSANANSNWDTISHHSANDYSSYAGSFGSNSDWGQNDNDGLGPFAQDDSYNPTDFDIRDASPSDYTNSTNPAASLNNPNSLSFFDHENLQPDVLADLELQSGHDQFIHLSFTPAEPLQKLHNHHHSSPFVNPSDISSPGSSPGSVHNNNDEIRSCASSVSPHHSPLPTFGSLPKQHRDGPQFSTMGPSPPASPPQIKATSPPALVIPSETTSVPNQVSLSQSHLLPGQAGIDINIVPSTPISGGAANTSSFQHVLQNLNAQSQGGSGDDRQGQTQSVAAAATGSPRPPQDTLMGAAIDVNSPQMWTLPQPSPQGSPGMPPFRSPLGHFRNPSEESVRIAHSLQSSPNLSPAPFPRGSDLATGLVNLTLGLNGQPFVSSVPPANDMLFASHNRNRSRSDTSVHPPSWGPHAQQGATFPGQANFGLGGLGLNVNAAAMSPPGAFHPLSYDVGSQQQIGVLPPFRMNQQSFDDSDNMLLPGIRRSRSDAGHGGHRRGVRSEDFSMYGLPPPPGDSDMLRSITTPDGSLAPSDPRVSPNLRRRGSSRGHERGSSLSSGRPSPYPSPSASPRHPDEMLPVGLEPTTVSRPHVTTPATAVASNSRRKSEANFVCPVPGCGSTFTRHFNLKGHLRSHNEERPFKCKWPGCEKGFARQHDCKRHEALHLNIRPYTCEGCGKTFARMDALNRHLRSEGGVECRRLGDDGTEMTTGFADPMTITVVPHVGGMRDGEEWRHGGLVL